ncbi:transient receptor potential cation channel subfamily V member 6-like [Acanthaster planci]|uniref:Transient receptor potential cation channel subfamily V member 6-like n=1 Tax=Acanthaster planci TaxID=133434 RepID=A0A8B7XK26_ACAPL|nr:transient receptor potential cation channel subfamily V member 6-like [Acanthaster planci]
MGSFVDKCSVWCHTGVASPFDAGKPERQWKRQHEQYEKNPVYKLVHFAGRGRLVEEFYRLSEEDFREFLQRRVRPFLYNGGEGKSITKVEYATIRQKQKADLEARTMVKRMSSKELVLQFDRSQLAAINRFRQREACWDLARRGEVGETALHLCLLNNTETHLTIARIMLEMYPKMALDIYEGDDYFGESCLHFAIINNNLEWVKLLVGRYKARLDQRATGRFFRPTDLKEGTSSAFRPSNYEGNAYYGEYPLAFAASVGNVEIYDYLVAEGLKNEAGRGTVNPDAKDSFGNTVVHMVIIHNQKHMISHIINHTALPARHDIFNHAGLTPLELSYRLGRGELFAHLLDLSSETQWTHGTVASVAYPLTGLDSIGPGGELNERSALRMIVQGSKLQHLKMLEGHIIQKLLEEKWNRYAKKILLVRFAWTIFHLSLISAAVYFRPSGDLMTVTDATSYVRFTAEVLVLVSCAVKFFIGFYELRTQHGTVIKSFIELPEKCLSLVSVCLLYACVPLRLLRQRQAEDALFIMAVVLSWCYLLLFYRAHKKLGPLVVMIGKMCTGDLLRFVIIYCIFIYMFAGVFYYAYFGVSEQSGYIDIKSTLVTMFHMTFSKFQTADLRSSRAPWQVGAAFVVFALVLPVLLLNMLIAKMARTFEKIKDRSRMEWKRQWAMIILNMERSLTHASLDRYQKAYSTEVRMGRAPAVREVLSHQPHRTSMSWKEHVRDTSRRHFGSFKWQRSLREEYLSVDNAEKGESEGLASLASQEQVEDEVEKDGRLCRALLVTKTLPKGKARVTNVCARWREAGQQAFERREVLS